MRLAGRRQGHEWNKVFRISHLFPDLASAKYHAAVALDPGVGFEDGLIAADPNRHADCAGWVGEEYFGEERPSQAAAPGAGKSRRGGFERPDQAPLVRACEPRRDSSKRPKSFAHSLKREEPKQDCDRGLPGDDDGEDAEFGSPELPDGTSHWSRRQYNAASWIPIGEADEITALSIRCPLMVHIPLTSLESYIVI
jgi:hypothetical protein